MADVDLSISVTTGGVSTAIKQLTDLTNNELRATKGAESLSNATAKLQTQMSNVAQGLAKARGAYRDLDSVLSSVRTSTDDLNRIYSAKAEVQPGTTAAQRLAAAYGSVSAGLAEAARQRQLLEAQNATTIGDASKVEAERAAEVTAAKQRSLELTNAQSRATSAQAALASARWERELAGLTPVEAAQRRLIRATQELATSSAMVNRAREAVAKNRTAETLDREAAASTRAAQAIQQHTRAQQELDAAQQQNEKKNRSSFSESYSYFILAGLAQQATQNITALGAAAVTASAQVERGFADVERTFDGTDTQLQALQQRLLDLSTETPVSVTDLSEIATLGNQLGIAANDIETFTTTIAKYSAVSGESANSAATAFGQISNLTGLAASQYGNLASAITYVARTTVATESTIQATSKEITALASGAGFSADSIVGLAGALSSLAIPPERARGALSLYFGALNTAVAEGGPKLEAFAKLTNMTADQLQYLVNNNQGQQVFTAFISGLSDLNNVAKTTALDTLGLSTIRVDQTMRALSQNVDLVTNSFAGAKQAFNENTEISRQYSIIQETLLSKWTEFQNAIQKVAMVFGNALAPAAKAALDILTKMLDGFVAFSQSPLGQGFLVLATSIAVIVGALTAAVGVFALTAATVVILRHTLQEMTPAWTTASGGVRGLVASLVSADVQARKSALSMLTFGNAARAVSAGVGSAVGKVREMGVGAASAAVGTKALGVAMSFLKFALPILAISAAIALFQALADSIDKAANPSKQLGDDLSGLKEALIADNKSKLSTEVAATGSSASGATGHVSAFNAALIEAVNAQQAAKTATDSTTSAIDAQSLVLGEASKAWISNALLQSDAIKQLVSSDYTFNPGGGGALSQERFLEAITAGLDINNLAQVFTEHGEEAAQASFDAFSKRFGFTESEKQILQNKLFGDGFLNPGVLAGVSDAYGDAAVSAALAGAATADAGTAASTSADDFDKLGNYVGDAGLSADQASTSFQGTTNRLEDMQNALQDAIKGYVSFDNVLQRAEDAAQAVADATKAATGENVDPAPVDVSGFGDALQSATDDALKFYNGITTLASSGNTAFALQLAELGPEAQGILSGALELDGPSQAKLEAAARFAAFIGSDAFKQTLEAEMTDSNNTYALIYKATGDLNDVKSFIEAEQQGIQQQWIEGNTELPLSVKATLLQISENEASQWAQEQSGRITVTANVVYDYGGLGGPQAMKTGNETQTVRDTLTGNSVTIPATIDGQALSDVVAQWQRDENATPQELEAVLNTDGFSPALDAWRQQHGPVELETTLKINVPYVPGFTNSGLLDPSNWIKKRNGGIIPGFASGGGYGLVSGPGSGISDSILARLSAGEYVNTAASTKFWGADFFDSLNRKTLPTSFLNMLGAAAVSGNQGPQNVTNVNVTQVNPVTRDPLKQLRENSEALAAGIWGG